MCTDCILARITVINVISGDYGTYKLRATSEVAVGYMSEDSVKLYRKFKIILIKLSENALIKVEILKNLRNSRVPAVYHKSR